MKTLSQRVRIKVCGITRRRDAEAAIRAGADALGFVFYAKSPRALDAGAAAAIVSCIPAFVSRVGLFVNALENEVATVLDSVDLDILQFHGDETPAQCAAHGQRWIKAIRMHPETDPMQAAQPFLDAGAAGVLLDAWDADRFGGSGHSFDWSRAAGGRDWPLILAGGLNPDNVSEAVKTVRPYAVDVSSGVESSPGIKDERLMRAFCTSIARSNDE